jgi:hypothetical protein
VGIQRKGENGKEKGERGSLLMGKIVYSEEKWKNSIFISLLIVFSHFKDLGDLKW